MSCMSNHVIHVAIHVIHVAIHGIHSIIQGKANLSTAVLEISLGGEKVKYKFIIFILILTPEFESTHLVTLCALDVCSLLAHGLQLTAK
jgi:hypothetical protein